MPLPAITPLPTAPTRDMESSVFVTTADAFVAALPGFRTEINAYGDALVLAAAAANYSTTSTTSLAIATGSKTFAAAAGKMFVVGQYVMAASAADATKWMHGQVTAYNFSTGSLTVNVDLVGVGGTVSDWSIGLSGPLPVTGWQTIATVSTTSGSTFDFTSIPTSYSDLILRFIGVSHNSGSAATLTLSLSPDGTTYTGAFAITNSMAASGSWRGSIVIPGYNDDDGMLNGAVESITSSPGFGVPVDIKRAWFSAGGIKALRVAMTIGTGDAGSLVLRGRK
jgi:hypothetical protein